MPPTQPITLLPIPVELTFLLSLQQLHSMSPALLIEEVRGWIKEKDPICLLHPHGFWIVLLNKSEMQEWRFHYWPRGPRKITGMPAMIHTHDRVVDSRILVGELKNILYNTTNIGSDGRPIYEVAYYGDKFVQETSNVLKKTGEQAKVVPKVATILQIGNSYRVEPHTYHEAVVPKELSTATIVCMHSRVPGPAKVLGLPSYPEEIVFQRLTRPARELLQHI